MQTSFYSEDEIKDLGFKSVGQDVLISRKISIYGAENISIGNHVRIDDFSILSGNITLGDHIHISAYCALYGKAGIVLMDYSGMSAKSMIYSVSDDYSGEHLVGVCVPEQFRNVIQGNVILKKFVQLGASTIVMPGLTIGEGTVTGVMTFVNKSLESWGIYTGIPAKRLKDRSRNLLNVLGDKYE